MDSFWIYYSDSIEDDIWSFVMNRNEIKKYDECLEAYSSIMQGKKYSEEEIKKYLKCFESFEDYEKCKDLIEIINRNKSIN